MLQLANALLRINGFWTPLLEYCLTAAVVGIMQISYHAFAVWLGVASTFYFSAHLVYEWRSLTWTVMAAEALEYTLYPSILYGITRMVLPIVNPTAVQYIMNTALQRGYIRTPAQHKQWAVWSAMGSVSAVAVAPLWSIALGARLPAFMDPVALAAKLKGELVSMFDRMGLTMGSQVVGQSRHVLDSEPAPGLFLDQIAMWALVHGCGAHSKASLSFARHVETQHSEHSAHHG
jgi:hypothetical protein